MLFVLVDATHIRLMCFFSAPTHPVQNNLPHKRRKQSTSQSHRPLKKHHIKEADGIMSQCHGLIHYLKLVRFNIELNYHTELSIYKKGKHVFCYETSDVVHCFTKPTASIPQINILANIQNIR